MRITRDTLLKVAGDAVARKSRYSSDVLAAYLVGSLLGEDFLLGGAADVDLVFVHTEPVEIEREIVRMTDEVHLDIAHHYQRDYRDTRALRVDPWRGPALTTCRVLYDPQHFLDFTQASVRGQYDRADHIFERSYRQLEVAREDWLELQASDRASRPLPVEIYLQIIEKSANSIATLTGAPLTERRFLAGFQHRAQAIDKPGLYEGVLGLLGGPNLQPGVLMEWFSNWQDAYLALSAPPAHLHPDRLVYYTSGFRALLNSDRPLDVLWPLLTTWTDAVSLLPETSIHVQRWMDAVNLLGLAGVAFEDRIIALDAFLDVVDEILETWARANGAWES